MVGADFQNLDRLVNSLDPATQELLRELAGGRGATAAPDVRANARVKAVMNALMAEALDRHAKALFQGLEMHASALKTAADGSEKYAGRLVWATWALVAATLALLAGEVIPRLMGGSH